MTASQTACAQLYIPIRRVTRVKDLILVLEYRFRFSASCRSVFKEGLNACPQDRRVGKHALRTSTVVPKVMPTSSPSTKFGTRTDRARPTY